MTQEQIDAIIEYVDAAIEQKTDNCESSDAGLLSSVRADEAKEKLQKVLLSRSE